MSGAGHTPGPWAAEDVGGVWEIRGRLADGRSVCVAVVNYDGEASDEVEAADARLLAAALKLRDALRGLVALRMEPGAVDDGTALEAAVQALAEADGWS